MKKIFNAKHSEWAGYARVSTCTSQAFVICCTYVRGMGVFWLRKRRSRIRTDLLVVCSSLQL